MTVAVLSGPTSAATSTSSSGGFAALGQQDFFRLLTVQMQQQDPFDPVDNKEMLAQMAQFASLAGISTMGDTLQAISDKLDALITLQQAAEDIDGANAAQTPSDPT